MNAAVFRQLALSLPESEEGAHMGHADFRVAGKIFATLALVDAGFGVLLLTPEQQAEIIDADPDVFSPVPGGWGRRGATRVRLARTTTGVLASALRTAWRRKAPKRLLRALPDEA